MVLWMRGGYSAKEGSSHERQGRKQWRGHKECAFWILVEKNLLDTIEFLHSQNPYDTTSLCPTCAFTFK